MTTRVRYLAAPLLALALLGACGDDDEGGDDAASEIDEGGSEGAGGGTGELDELCALATEIYEQDDFPSPEQLDAYASLAPAELQDAVATAGEAVSAGGGEDFVAVFAAIAEDAAERAILEINTFEEENCGIDHSEDSTVPVEVDENANRVDVTATDYAFEFGPVPAGPTSFVMVNEGEEAHFMVLTRILDGHTLDEALAHDGDPEEAGLVEDVEGGDSPLAAPGGEDEEVMNVDLEPGNYAMLCFIGGPDGTPHAFTGMAEEFTVE